MIDFFATAGLVFLGVIGCGVGLFVGGCLLINLIGTITHSEKEAQLKREALKAKLYVGTPVGEHKK